MAPIIEKDIREGIGEIKEPGIRVLLWVLIAAIIFIIYEKRKDRLDCKEEKIRLIERNSKLDSLLQKKDEIIYRMNYEATIKAQAEQEKIEAANNYWDSVLKKTIKINSILKNKRDE